MFEKPYHSSDLSKYKFLITGGAGFIGSNIVEYLVKYNAGKIKVLDDLSTGFLENLEPFLNKIELVKGSIENYATCMNACEDIDFISHQAALGSVPRSIEFPLATNSVNASGFLNIITAAKESGVKRIVYASSSSVYGDSKILPKTEEQIGKPLSPYAVSKYIDELYAGVYASVYGTEVIGLRYFNIFGPRQNPKGAYAAAIPLFMDALKNNISPKIFGDGKQTRDFTFVENAVQANIKALFTKHTEALGEVFNIAYGDRTSILDMFTILKGLTQASVEPEFKNERKGDVRDSLADITKAKNLLAYEPTVNFEQGLKITLDWFEQKY
ncbi:MAG: SDR family oxidoreductase [Bacteroidetes bacterium]|nr:SDR family oxidoreductase [Bacteroidota bacterium]HET6245700.1 SDR family oxidoreductase [Bacteroidia bacterium]